MAGQMTSRTSTGKTAGRNDTKNVTATDASERATEPAAQTSTSRDQRPTSPPEPPRRPEPSPRTGVLVNVDSIELAFTTGSASQSVGYVQHVLRARGLEPGDPTGIADRQTRSAVAKFQESIGEQATGVPTARTLDYLGFDVT